MAIDRTEFAKECVRQAIRFGVNLHYMLAVAQLRSGIGDQVQDNLFGPFRLRQTEWDANRNDDQFDLHFSSAQISDPFRQCAVFGLMAHHAFDSFVSRENRNPSARELYLQQWSDATSATLTADFQKAVGDTAALVGPAADAVLDDPQLASRTIGNVDRQGSAQTDSSPVQKTGSRPALSSPPTPAEPNSHPPQLAAALAPPATAPNPALPPTGAGLPLIQAGLQNVCQQLGVKAAEIWAIIFTETDPPYGGFWGDGRPQILFERHIFSRLTNHRFDQTHPSISSPTPGGYGASGAHQYARLAEATQLDETAALQAASWGIGQTLGENYHEVGFVTPQEMAKQMYYSEDQQLLAAAREILSSHIAGALATHDWKAFASIYNGPTYAKNNYDSHLQSWYAKLVNGGLPDLTVRSAQIYLMYLGYEPSTIDGMWGQRTQGALNAYQAKVGLPLTDQVDAQTFAKLMKDGQAAIQKPVPVA